MTSHDPPLQDDPAYIAEIRRRSQELEEHLSELGERLARMRAVNEELERSLLDFTDRLRGMRARNRAAHEQLEAFGRELDALHDFLTERL